MRNIDRGITFAENLVGLGCQLALDDFGTGFASFTYLKSLPVRYLKIDIEFVRDLVTSRPGQIRRQRDRLAGAGIRTGDHRRGRRRSRRPPISYESSASRLARAITSAGRRRSTTRRLE